MARAGPIPCEQAGPIARQAKADDLRLRTLEHVGRSPRGVPSIRRSPFSTAEVAAEARKRARPQSFRPFADPWPLARWPSVPTKVVACRRDRLFPLELVRRVSEERLGITPDEIDSGHLPALGRPEALVELLERYRAELDA